MKINMLSKLAIIVATSFCIGAQAQTPSTKSNILALTAQSSVKAPQDFLSITVGATKEGVNGQAVQAELKKVLDSALAQANPLATGEALKVRTGQFRVVPVYDNKDQRIQSWRATAQLVLEGKDFVRIASLAANIPGMPVVNVSFGLSPEGRVKYESEAQR